MIYIHHINTVIFRRSIFFGFLYIWKPFLSLATSLLLRLSGWVAIQPEGKPHQFQIICRIVLIFTSMHLSINPVQPRMSLRK